MKRQTQDAYISVAMKGSPLYNELQEMVSDGSLEKRSGVIILTPEELDKIKATEREKATKSIQADLREAIKAANDEWETFDKYNTLTEYTNQLITP